MPEAYVFSTAAAPDPAGALSAALSSAGLGPRALAEVTWLGEGPRDLPGDFPLLHLAPGPAHLVLQTLLRRLQSGERGVLALGQTGPGGCLCLVLGGPAVVGRLNLLPAWRLSPAAPLPGQAEAAAEAFRLSLTPPLPLEDPSEEDAPQQPVIISPAMPAPPPPALPEPPSIAMLLSEAGDPPFYPAARRLEARTGLEALHSLLSALTAADPWGALATPLARGWLLTLAEKL